MAKKILISFKENEEEIKLYLEVKGKPQKKQSEFVKKALREFIDKENRMPKRHRKSKNKESP